MSTLLYIAHKAYIEAIVLFFFFFFQAEDGIRDYKVTGVQTCALPISFPGIACVHGVSYDGSQVWFATGTQLQALDPDSGRIVRSIPVPGDAGTAFDGRHLFQIEIGRAHV